MALKKCKECGGQVSTSAKVCPSCGAKAPRKTSIFAWMVLLTFLVIIWESFNNDVSPESGNRKTIKTDEVQSERHVTEQKGRKFLWLEKGKEAVLARLKDPDSAKFQNVYFNRSKADIPVACGQVNSKNSMGGYTGFKHFISAGSPDRTWLENEVKDFENLWNQLCK